MAKRLEVSGSPDHRTALGWPPAFRARTLRGGGSLRWWVELGTVAAVVIVAAVLLPSISPPGIPASARGHGDGLVAFERTFGLFHEHAIQAAVLGMGSVFGALANWWYGLMHFAVTAAVFVWLYRRHSDDYPRWRNTLAISAVAALAIQAVWPATPPRLLAGSAGAPIFRDTLTEFSALWSFSAKGGVANQYAAMPSMHAVWALICACIVVPRVSNRWIKVAAIAYPVITVLAIVVTGNHYFVDALGAVPIVALGYLIARRFTRAGRRPSMLHLAA